MWQFELETIVSNGKREGIRPRTARVDPGSRDLNVRKDSAELVIRFTLQLLSVLKLKEEVGNWG
jgi:hypothetical protein